MLDNRIRTKRTSAGFSLEPNMAGWNSTHSCSAFLSSGPHAQGQEAGASFRSCLHSLCDIHSPHSKRMEDYCEFSFPPPVTMFYSPKATKIIRFLKCILSEKFSARVSKTCSHINTLSHFYTNGRILHCFIPCVFSYVWVHGGVFPHVNMIIFSYMAAQYDFVGI